MKDDSSALTQQFRASLEARARDVAALLEDYKASPALERLQELKGELHTLKGEARVLGLDELATIVHGIEAMVESEEELDFTLVSAAVDAIVTALAPDISDSRRRTLLATTIDALGLEGPVPLQESAPSDVPDPVSRLSEHLRKGRRWVQVDAAVVDELCESLAALSGDLSGVSARAEEARSAKGSHDSADFRAVMDDLASCRVRLEDSVVRAFSLRLAPIEPTLLELARHLRQIALETDKQVEVLVEARGVQLERDALRNLWDPLLHLGRNAVAHGIEPIDERGAKSPIGSIKIKASTVGTHVVVTIADDGRGIQLERVRQQAERSGRLTAQSARASKREDLFNLLFEPGFSTKGQVDQWAGRGIGLDVVKRQVEELAGEISLETEEEAGTTFTLSVPASVMKERLFVFNVQSTLFALPAHLVLAIERRSSSGVKKGNVAPVGDGETHRFNEEFLPLCSFSTSLFGLADCEEPFVAILHLGGKHFAAAFPAFVGEFDLIRRPAGRILSKTSGVTASAMIEGGRIALVLDAAHLKNALQGTTGGALRPRTTGTRDKATAAPRILAADDSPIVRDLVSEVLGAAGYEVKCAANGLQALEYLDSFAPALVLSDIEMPQMNGFELLEAIRHRTRTLPVILLTARGSIEDRQRASALGANAYVAKGEFKRETLVELVDRFCPR